MLLILNNYLYIMEFEKCNVDQPILRLRLIKNKLKQLVEQIITLTQ